MKSKHRKTASPSSDKDTPDAAATADGAAAQPGQEAEASAERDPAEPAGSAATAQEAAPPPVSGPETAAVETKAADERYLRLLADFENFRKRTLREKHDVHRTANEELLKELLPVLDHLHLALDAARAVKADRAVLDGFTMVSDQLAAAVNKFGAVPLESEGQAFDPALHEAIAHLPSETVPENAVMRQTRRGYMIGNKLLRAAQVIVSSGPAAAPEPDRKEE